MKIRTIIACLLSIACMTTSVSAQINAVTNEQNDSITIFGTVSTDDVQVVLLKPGFEVSNAEDAAASTDKSKLGGVVEYFGQVMSKDNYIETSIPMRSDAEKEKYLLAIDKETYSVYFAPYKERLENMIPAAKLALSNGTFAEFAESDGKYFCNSDMYEALSNKAKVAKYAADILDEYKNSSDSEFMSKLILAMNTGIIMEALNEKQADDLNIVKSMTDNADMTVPMEKMDLIKSEKLKNVISDISGKNYSSVDEYKKTLSESIFINVINNATDMNNKEKKAFFDDYAKKLGLDLTNYNKLSENKKTEAIAKLAAENKTTINSLQSALDEICKDSTTSTGVTGGNNGVTGSPDFGIRVTPNVAANANANVGLSDLSQCKWAQPAIEYLVNSKTISGYEDNTFKPFKSISRAEFVTIIARKYLPVSSYAQSFSDVSSDKWCFSYVEGAYNCGIISGKGNGRFAPDEDISRQDMAVILCKLAAYINRDVSGVSAEFADNSDIADYAKDAIYKLRSLGIVNGDENGNFNPKAPATRAEAAQMIYNFIKILD